MHRERSIRQISQNTSLSTRDVIKGLSILVHFNFVSVGTKSLYSANIPEINRSLLLPIYLEYIEKRHGKDGVDISLELINKVSLSTEEVPSQFTPTLEKMAAEGLLSRTERRSQEQEQREKEEEFKEQREKKLRGDKDSKPPSLHTSLSLNVPRIETKIFHSLLLEDVERRYNTRAKDILQVLLNSYPISLPFSSIPTAAASGSSGSSGSDGSGSGLVEDQSQSLASPERVLREYLTYFVSDGTLTLFNNTYHVNIACLKERLRRQTVSQYISRKIGPEASSIFNLLSSRGAVEDLKLQHHLLMENSAIKKNLMALYSLGLIDTQMIPRTPECLPSKSFHFWRVHPSSSESALKFSLLEDSLSLSSSPLLYTLFILTFQ